MKCAVVCYSLEGNSLLVAERLAGALDATLVRLESVKRYPTSGVGKFAVGGKDSTFNKRPELKPYDFVAEDFDLVVICSPVWAGRVAAPVNTFLAENDLSDCGVALCIQSAGGGPDKCYADFLSKLGQRSDQSVPMLGLVNPANGTSEPELEAKLAAFADELIGR